MLYSSTPLSTIVEICCFIIPLKKKNPISYSDGVQNLLIFYFLKLRTEYVHTLKVLHITREKEKKILDFILFNSSVLYFCAQSFCLDSTCTDKVGIFVRKIPYLFQLIKQESTLFYLSNLISSSICPPSWMWNTRKGAKWTPRAQLKTKNDDEIMVKTCPKILAEIFLNKLWSMILLEMHKKVEYIASGKRI